MSNKTSPYMSQQQRQYIASLTSQKSQLQQKNQQLLKSILQSTYEMQEVGNNTNVTLQGQTQQLINVKKTTDKTKKIIHKAEETSKEITSFWYGIGKKIKKIFVKDQQDDEDDGSQPSTNTQNKRVCKTQQDQARSDDLNQFRHVKCQQTQDDNFKSQPDQIEDEHIDEITEQIRKLKGLARNTNQHLTKQTDLINQIDKNVDYNSNKIEEISKRLKKKFF